jgi:hypothetical protein
LIVGSRVAGDDMPKVTGSHPEGESRGVAVQCAACTSYSRPEPSSKENNLTNTTNGAVGNTSFYSQSARSINKTIRCSARRGPYCPLPHS